MTAVDTSLIMLNKDNIKSKFKFSEGTGIGFRMLDTPRKSVDFEVVVTFNEIDEMPIFQRVSFLPENRKNSYEEIIAKHLKIVITPAEDGYVRFKYRIIIELSDNNIMKQKGSTRLPVHKIRGLFSKPKPR